MKKALGGDQVNWLTSPQWALTSVFIALSALSVAGPAVAAETGGDQKFPAMQMIMDESGQPTTSTFTVALGTYSANGNETVLRAAVLIN